MRWAVLVAGLLLVSACAGPAPGADPGVRFRLANAGSVPMQCQIMFGHWVDRDLGVVAPGGAVAFVAQQQHDGALYVERSDGQRRMMIENIFCARPNDWQASVDEVDLAAVRIVRPGAVDIRCMPRRDGRVACGKPTVL